MKKLFILAAAIIALASCQKEQASYVEDGSIKFTTMETRTAVSDINDLTGDGKGFTVFGFANDVEIFSNVDATYATGDSKEWWEMTTKRYWADNTTYNFFAVYPKVTGDNKFTLATEGEETVAEISFTNDGKTDLILAGTNVKTTTGTDGAGHGPAHMTFKHALSRVAFAFKNGYKPAENSSPIYIDVQNLEFIGEAGDGVVNVKSVVGQDEQAITWTTVNKSGNISFMEDNVVDDKDKTEMFTNAGYIAKDETATTDYKYIIPAVDVEYKIACKITAYYDINGDKKLTDADDVIREFDYTSKHITLAVNKATKFTHEMGKSYTYTMTVAENLNEITFTVNVEDWTTGGSANIDFPGDNSTSN